MRVVVLGAGRVGSAIVRDLARDDAFSVTVADLTHDALEPLAQDGVATEVADLADPAEIRRVLAGQDLAIGAVPGHMGFATLETVIDAGCNVVDISFFPEDPLALDALARERNVVAVVDAGIAPGCGNIILGHLRTVLARVDRFTCYVGGLPAVRTLPFEYKAGFSPIDVIEEYVRPARYMTGGRVVTRPALSEAELLDFPGVGTVEAFNTDGLRTLLDTCAEIPEMKEKTLRYPGHIDRVRMLRDVGFFSKDAVTIGDVSVRPLDLTARLLFPMWEMRPREEDLTVMRVEVEGSDGQARLLYTYDLLDRYDRVSGTTSMARTTGYTCTAVARLLARGAYARPGISPPEYVGAEKGCYAFVIRELAARGVAIQETVENVP